MPVRESTRRAGPLLAALISAGCAVVGGPGGDSAPPPVDYNVELSMKIEEAEALWNEQAINSYFIEVAHVQSIWHAQWQQVIVRDGVIEAAEGSCIPAPFEGRECEVESFDPENYTVPGLFERAYAAAQSHSAAEWVEITFDPTYGYPASIDFDNPEAEDDDWLLRVETFSVLR